MKVPLLISKKVRGKIMYFVLVVLLVLICILQFIFAKKNMIKTTLLLAVLVSIIVVLLILFGIEVLRLYIIVCAFLLWVLFVWTLLKKRK